MTARLVFFAGKGGVGKSTLAALFALGHAERGRDVLLLSLDPAHNLGDIFGQEQTVQPAEVRAGLQIYEPDIQDISRHYLRDIEEQLRASYRYLTSINIDRYFSVLRHSPGLDEYAMSLLFRTTISRYGGKDIIVFDMPPTALALRFFAAPSVSTIWIEQLIALRSIILERKEMITRVTLASSTVETDKILQRLERERTLYAGQTEALQREGSAIHIVINPDELSRQEGRRIGRELTALNLPLGRSMLNKADVTAGMDFDEELPAPLLLPRSAFELTGIEALHRYLEMHGAALLAS